MRRNHLQSWSPWLALAASILILALSWVQIVATAERGARRVGVDIEEESSRIHVVGLASGGPAERGGVAVGDRLISIAGRRLERIEDFDRAARTFRRGQPVSLEVERDDGQATLEVTPGMPVDWTRPIGRIAVGLLSLVIGIVALAGRSGDVRARLLSALFFFIALEFAWPEEMGFDSLWRMIGPVFFYIGTGVQLAIELHLASVLPRPDAWPKRRRAFVAAVYSFGLLIATVGTATYLIESVRPYLLPWSVYQFDELVHQVALPAWALGMVALLAFAASRAPLRQDRLRAGLVLLGVIPWAVYILAGWWLGYPDRGSGEGWAAVMPLLVLCFPISVFIAIFRYHLFDLEIVVRRGLVYSTLTTILVGLFYAALGAGGALFSRIAGENVGSVGSFAVATLLLGSLFAPLRKGVQRLIDRRFFPEREVMRRRLVELAGDLSTHGDAKSMGARLVQEMCAIFRISSATLLLTRPDGDSLVRLAWSGPLCVRDNAPPAVRSDTPWVAALRQAARPTDVARLRCVDPERTLPRWAHAPSTAVPLMVGKRLVAVLILGEKRQGIRYSKEELELLGLLAHHCAITFDNARLVRTATYEGLTGLLRREAVLEGLTAEIARARRHGRPLTVALADIDHFKRINDRFGHVEGDRVLRAVAGEMSARIRASDFVGRYGGEEFLLVFPETGVGAGVAIAEQLRKAVAELPLKDDRGGPIEVRLSIGVAELADRTARGAAAVPDLLAAADRSLYRAKKAGRNRVEADQAPKPTLAAPA